MMKNKSGPRSNPIFLVGCIKLIFVKIEKLIVSLSKNRMNKIIIIGNGFDLAHSLKTSYKDLMDFIRIDAKLEGKMYGRCQTIHYDEKGFIAFKYPVNGDGIYSFTTCKESKSIYFTELFSHYNKYAKWVDLETLFFNKLSENINNPTKLKILYEEFEFLKDLLEKYLSEQIENKLPDYLRNFRESFFSGYENENLAGIINFNYTNKAINYHLDFLRNFSSKITFPTNFQLINIHGKLNSKQNPIIFGYGDDNSDNYKVIQNKQNDILLKNFKTFQYLRTSNYHKVLTMLEVNKDIKVEIIGHSCGLSDKTLLKTIFQHPNVKKIEYRYHQNENKYFDNIYNISRIFDNNIMMREKVLSLEKTRIIPELDLRI